LALQVLEDVRVLISWKQYFLKRIVEHRIHFDTPTASQKFFNITTLFYQFFTLINHTPVSVFLFYLPVFHYTLLESVHLCYLCLIWFIYNTSKV
jgi:hypothetical protein